MIEKKYDPGIFAKKKTHLYTEIKTPQRDEHPLTEICIFKIAKFAIPPCVHRLN